MEFVEIMKWVGFVAALIGGGWGALKLKAWFTLNANSKGIEAGVMIETPFGIGKVVWREGENVKIELLETGEKFVGLTKEMKILPAEKQEEALKNAALEQAQKNALQRLESTRAARLRSKKKGEK